MSTTNDAVRVRFSPSPTGMLHIGGARTALFNFLYARHTGGVFALRIEDSDVARSTAESVAQIQEVLGWLGLHWDEGPFLQSDSFDAHRAAAARLVADGNAYECYCTKDELDARAEAAKAAGRPPGYDGTCRDLDDATRAARRAEGREVAIRFRTPDTGTSRFHDVVRGDVAVEWSTISDFVIVRPGGVPLFFLANAVDDIAMGITHVIRGEDLLDTTHRVLAIRRALGRDDQPVYAHCPLILGPGGHKLSKRHGAVSVEDFRDAGYLPGALLNFLALLGWGPDDDRQVMTLDELVEAFDIVRINKSSATFDVQKLEWMNGEHIRMLDLDALVAAVRPFAIARSGADLDDAVLHEAVRQAQARATTLAQIADQCAFLFVADAELPIAEESWEKLVATEQIGPLLDAVIAHCGACEWTVDAIDLRPVLEPLGLKPRKALPAIYTAIEGRHQGLPLFDSMHLLGRDSVLARLRAAQARLGAH